MDGVPDIKQDEITIDENGAILFGLGSKKCSHRCSSSADPNVVLGEGAFGIVRRVRLWRFFFCSRFLGVAWAWALGLACRGEASAKAPRPSEPGTRVFQG